MRAYVSVVCLARGVLGNFICSCTTSVLFHLHSSTDCTGSAEPLSDTVKTLEITLVSSKLTFRSHMHTLVNLVYITPGQFHRHIRSAVTIECVAKYSMIICLLSP